MRIAIVMPALNEAEALRHHLPGALAAVTEGGQLVVSDGGSTDGTLEVARALGARTVSGPPGRGGQLNRGAAALSNVADAADILLFLHADTDLPPGAMEAVRAAVEGGAIGGAFRLRFDVDRPMQRLGARLINLRSRLGFPALGDQAQFVRRDAFLAMGGFRDWPILEDIDFALRLRHRGRTALLEGKVTTAARRFVEQGAVRTVATNWLIWLLFLLGVPPHRLARLYRQIR
jgi:rSAM/selenodomain-associated transferase 2